MRVASATDGCSEHQRICTRDSQTSFWRSFRPSWVLELIHKIHQETVAYHLMKLQNVRDCASGHANYEF